MSMSINGLGATSMLAQLQKMQQQMRTLSMASADNQMLNQNVNNTPVFNQPEVTTTSGAICLPTKIEDEVTDIPCDVCGRMMVIKYGPHGKFLACPGSPECRNTKPYLERIGVACPKCGKDIVIKKTKKGRKYFGCEGFPECDFMSWQKPSDKKCPECGGYMVEKGNKLVCADEHCGYVMDKMDK